MKHDITSLRGMALFAHLESILGLYENLKHHSTFKGQLKHHANGLKRECERSGAKLFDDSESSMEVSDQMHMSDGYVKISQCNDVLMQAIMYLVIQSGKDDTDIKVDEVYFRIHEILLSQCNDKMMQWSDHEYIS